MFVLEIFNVNLIKADHVLYFSNSTLAILPIIINMTCLCYVMFIMFMYNMYCIVLIFYVN